MSTEQPTHSARQAGMGVLWLSLAKFYFMGTGLVLLIVLPSMFQRFAGEQHVAQWGDFRTVMGLINWFNMVLIGGTLQSVSKFVSEKEGRSRHVLWEGMKLLTVIGGLASLLLFAGAGLLANRYYGDARLADYLRLAAPIVLLYGWYAVVIGCMNGLRRFRHQASMDMLFATLKVGLTIALVAAGFAIFGAISGFLITAVVALVVSLFLLGRQEGDEKVSWKKLLGFQWKTLIFAFCLNGLLQIDLQLLKGFAAGSAETVSRLVGIYGASGQIAQIPYVAAISVAFVVFPLMSRATFENNTQQARDYVSTTNRYVFLALVGLVLPLVLDSAGVLAAVYPPEYVEGSAILSILSVGYLLFAGMVLNANILTGSGRPMTSMAIFAVALAVSAILNWFLVPRMGAQGAAIATTTATGAGFVASGFISYRQFGAFIRSVTFFRTALAVGLVVLFSRFVLPAADGLLFVLLRLSVNFVLYWVLLVVTRELPPGEIRRLVSLALRRRA